MSGKRNTKPRQNKNASLKRTAVPEKKKPRSRAIIAWSAGVSTTVFVAVLVTLVTGGLHVIWSAVNNSKQNSGPLVISPATLSPTSLGAGPGTTKSPAPRLPEIRYGHLKVEYLLSGVVPKEGLPAPAGLKRAAVTAPRSVWYLSLNAVGKSSSPVVITGISVHVVRRLPPRQVTSVDSCWQDKCTNPQFLPPTAAGAPLPVRNVAFNLDDPQSNINATPRAVGDFPYTVTRTDDEFFTLSLHSARCTCRWVVYVQWEQGGRAGTKLVDNSGSPFEVVTDRVVRRYCYDGGNNRGYANTTNPQAVRHICEKQ
jgi:hypothetical protein